MHNPTRLLITGFAAVIVMTIVLSLTAMNSIGVADRETSAHAPLLFDMLAAWPCRRKTGGQPGCTPAMEGHILARCE